LDAHWVSNAFPVHEASRAMLYSMGQVARTLSGETGLKLYDYLIKSWCIDFDIPIRRGPGRSWCVDEAGLERLRIIATRRRERQLAATA
jgi:hypothetical protein